jgi:DNA-binding beta-propeller fold protein YncE
MSRSTAEIVREYGPFPGVAQVHGVTYDGQSVWFAAGDTLTALDPASGKTLRSIDVAAHAGTAFDGQHLFQLAEDRIQKIDPQTGRVLATIPAPGGGPGWVSAIAASRIAPRWTSLRPGSLALRSRGTPPSRSPLAAPTWAT